MQNRSPNAQETQAEESGAVLSTHWSEANRGYIKLFPTGKGKQRGETGLPAYMVTVPSSKVW